MNLDNLREQTIDNLLVFLEDPKLTPSEQRIINNCASLLINNRSPQQISLMESKKFGDKNV